MNQLAPSQKQTKTWTADVGRRRSMRVLLSVPVVVSGKIDNRDFSEETRTLVVNAHGAMISLAAGVAPGQIVKISANTAHISRDCRIVYVGAAQAGKSQMGVEFIKPSPAFWQLDFPPDDWVVPEN